MWWNIFLHELFFHKFHFIIIASKKSYIGWVPPKAFLQHSPLIPLSTSHSLPLYFLTRQTNPQQPEGDIAAGKLPPLMSQLSCWGCFLRKLPLSTPWLSLPRATGHVWSLKEINLVICHSRTPLWYYSVSAAAQPKHNKEEGWGWVLRNILMEGGCKIKPVEEKGRLCFIWVVFKVIWIFSNLFFI